MQGTPEPHIWLDLARAALLSVPVYILYLLDRRKRKAEVRQKEADARSLEEASAKSKQDRLEGSLEKLWLLHGRVEELCSERDRLREQLTEAVQKRREAEDEIRRLRGNGKVR